MGDQRRPVMLTDEEAWQLRNLVPGGSREKRPVLWQAMQQLGADPVPWVTVNDNGDPVYMEPVPLGPAAQTLADAGVAGLSLYRAVPLNPDQRPATSNENNKENRDG